MLLVCLCVCVCDCEWCSIKPWIHISGHKLDLSYSDRVDTISRRSHVFTDCYVRLVAAIVLIFILIPAENRLKISVL